MPLKSFSTIFLGNSTMSVSTSSPSRADTINTSLKCDHPLWDRSALISSLLNLRELWSPVTSSTALVSAGSDSSTSPLFLNVLVAAAAALTLILLPLTTPSVSSAVMSSNMFLPFSRSTCQSNDHVFIWTKDICFEKYNIFNIIMSYIFKVYSVPPT